MMRSALPALLSLFSACGTSEEPPPDPVGTVSVTLQFGDRLCFGCTGVTDLTLDNVGNLAGMIASVGPVAGLGEITMKAAVMQVATTATPGNGYVVRANNAFDSYYAVYVTDYLMTTTGAAAGVYVKWAPLSAVSGLTITPNSVTIPIPTIGTSASPSISIVLTYTDGHTVDAHKTALYTMPACTQSPCLSAIDDPSDPSKLIIEVQPGTQPGTSHYSYRAQPYTAARDMLSVTTQ